MASDFGDEAGQELYDWMLRIGQDAGGKAMSDAAGRLAQALRNARSGIGLEAETAEAELPEWAKLDMAEFKELPEYESVQAAIAAKLESAGLAHSFLDDQSNGKTYLLFRIEDAERLDGCLGELIEQAEAAERKASDDLTREADRQAREAERDDVREAGDPDKEPLEKQAEYARAASEQLERERSGGRAAEREPRFQENRSK